jgi:hypothetical protein
MSSPRLQRALHAGRRLFGPLALLFLALAAYASADLALELLRRADRSRLLAACGVWTLLHLLAPLGAARTLSALGSPVGYRRALDIHVRRLPARYLPGGIWHTVSRLADLRQDGVPAARLAGLAVTENLLPLATALALGGLALLFAGWREPLAPVALAAGLAALLLPPLLVRAGRLRGRLPTLAPWLGIALVYALFWIGAAFAFWLYWSAFPAPAAALPLHVAGAYLLAWSAGFLMLFAPQGLGVFEVAIAAQLGTHLPWVGAAVLAAGFRVVMLVADGLAWALRRPIARVSQRARPR